MNGLDALREDVPRASCGCSCSHALRPSLSVWAFMVVLAIAAYDAGGAGDRSSRRTVLVALSAGATAILLLLTLVSAAGAALAAILALAACISIITSAQRPAQPRCFPGWAAGPRQLAAANGLWQILGNRACLAVQTGATYRTDRYRPWRAAAMV